MWTSSMEKLMHRFVEEFGLLSNRTAVWKRRQACDRSFQAVYPPQGVLFRLPAQPLIRICYVVLGRLSDPDGVSHPDRFEVDPRFRRIS